MPDVAFVTDGLSERDDKPVRVVEEEHHHVARSSFGV